MALAHLSPIHTSEISTSTNARNTHAQNQSSTNQAISARAYAWRLCFSHLCKPGIVLCSNNFFSLLNLFSNSPDFDQNLMLLPLSGFRQKPHHEFEVTVVREDESAMKILGQKIE